jgi:hypothetical protein
MHRKKLLTGQLLIGPAAKICAGLAGNFRHLLVTEMSVANGMVWVNVCYFTASLQGGGVGQICVNSVTQPYTTWPRLREQEGGCISSP